MGNLYSTAKGTIERLSLDLETKIDEPNANRVCEVLIGSTNTQTVLIGSTNTQRALIGSTNTRRTRVPSCWILEHVCSFDVVLTHFDL